MQKNRLLKSAGEEDKKWYETISLLEENGMKKSDTSCTRHWTRVLQN